MTPCLFSRRFCWPNSLFALSSLSASRTHMLAPSQGDCDEQKAVVVVWASLPGSRNVLCTKVYLMGLGNLCLSAACNQGRLTFLSVWLYLTVRFTGACTWIVTIWCSHRFLRSLQIADIPYDNFGRFQWILVHWASRLHLLKPVVFKLLKSLVDNEVAILEIKRT